MNSFCIPVILFYFVLRGKRPAYVLSTVYAVIMIVNEVGHNVATLVSGRYYGPVTGSSRLTTARSLSRAKSCPYPGKVTNVPG